MSPILFYLGKVILISGVLYSYYRCCLRNASFHVYNRYYLLSIPLISVVLPFLAIPLPGWTGGDWGGAPIRVLNAIADGHWNESAGPAVPSPAGGVFFISSTHYYGVYLVVMGGFMFSLFRSLLAIRRMCRSNVRMEEPRELVTSIREHPGKIQFYITDEPGTPFSFFRRIFWNRRLDLTSAKSHQIFRHELYHVQQGHSADILYLEILRIFFWFNPFFHLIRSEIKATHEFLADRYAAQGSDRHDYAELLVWHQITGGHTPMGNSFFNTHLKRRITMLTQLRTKPPGYFSRIMILPILFLLCGAFVFRLNKNSIPVHQGPVKTLTVVIDAGHGGFDPGTTHNDIQEKDLVLAIAQKVKQFSAAYNVNVLLTRSEDIMAGGKATIEEGLHFRTDFASEHQADLFVSVHINNAPDTSRGMQVYLSSANAFSQKSSMLGSSMVEAMKEMFVTGQVLQRVERVYVLKASKMPAIVIECGNMKNPEDLAFITNSENQDKVAKKILQGIVNYQQSLGEPGPAEKNATTNRDTRFMDIDELIPNPLQKKGC